MIANTTTTRMYEGLTVLLLTKDNLPKFFYQEYTGFEAPLSFPKDASWFPLMQCINRSMPSSSASMTIVKLAHTGHELYLNVYNSTGGHTGFNPALLNISKTAIEVIPDSYYLDLGNGTSLIALPSSVQSFTTVVDGTAMTEANEAYTLTYTMVQNGTVTSTKIVQGNISQFSLQSAAVTIQNGDLTVEATTITNSTNSISTTLTTSSSSTSSASSGSLNMTDLAPGIVVVVIVALAMVILARRRTTGSAPKLANSSRMQTLS